MQIFKLQSHTFEIVFQTYKLVKKKNCALPPKKTDLFKNLTLCKLTIQKIKRKKKGKSRVFG